MPSVEDTAAKIDQFDLSRRDLMKGGIGAVSLAALGTGAAMPAALSTASIVVTAGGAHAQSTAMPAESTQPATGITMFPGYARTIAQTAYVWGWPMVNMINRNARQKSRRRQRGELAAGRRTARSRLHPRLLGQGPILDGSWIETA